MVGPRLLVAYRPGRSRFPLPIEPMPLVNPASLFQLRFTCSWRERLWPPAASHLDAGCQLPRLAVLAGVPDLLELAVGWNEAGLGIRARLEGLSGRRWCQPTKPEDSDGLHLWIATRPTGESHRAGRFCRRLALLPTGGGRQADQPVAVAAEIPRANEPATPLSDKAVLLEARNSPTSWKLDAFITAAALPGWDPDESPRLGFFAAAVDRRLGKLPCFAPPEFPWESDPTTWTELLLSR